MNKMIPGRTKMNFTLRALSHPVLAKHLVVYVRETQPMCALRDRRFAERGKFAGHWPVCVLCVELNTHKTYCVPQDEMTSPWVYPLHHTITNTPFCSRLPSLPPTLWPAQFATNTAVSDSATALNSATWCRTQSGTVQFNNWSPPIALQTSLWGRNELPELEPSFFFLPHCRWRNIHLHSHNWAAVVKQYWSGTAQHSAGLYRSVLHSLFKVFFQRYWVGGFFWSATHLCAQGLHGIYFGGNVSHEVVC